MSAHRQTSGIARAARVSLRGSRLVVAAWAIIAAGWVSAQEPDDSHVRIADPSPFTGLAQAPEANLFVGTATTSIPIQVPPGRKNLTPQLALVYTSSGAPSPYGYGWDLPLGRIQRSTKHGVLTCANLGYMEDFVLILPGASIEFTRDPVTGKGRPRVEESFFRIQQSGDSWTVWDKSGIKYTFGDNINARTGNDPIDLLHPDSCGAADVYDPLYTFSWELTRIEDPNGNRVDVEYRSQVNLPAPTGDGVAYPHRVLYGGNAAGLAHSFEVDFIWSDEDHFDRPAGDEIVNGMGGFPAKLTRILSRIVVRHTGIVRWYGLDYELDVGTPRRGRQSFLSAVTLYDANNHALSRYDGQPASTTFLYADNPTGFVSTAFQTAPAVGNYGRKQVRGDTFDYTVRDIFDINGDGFPDMVDTAACNPSGPATRRWSVTLGSAGGLATTVSWSFNVAAPLLCHIRDDRITGGGGRHRWGVIETMDINGDGIPDWIDSSTWTPAAPYWQVYLGYVTATGGGFQTTPISWSAPFYNLRHIFSDDDIGGHGYSSGNGSVTLRDLIDLNGDGLPDLVQTPDSGQTGPWTVWLNTGDGFDVSGRLVSAAFPMLRWTRNHDVYYDEVLGLYDMNGDGLPDLVFAPPTGPWQAYMNTGLEVGAIMQPWVVPAPLNDMWLSRPGQHELFDINGDGLPDLVDARNWTTNGSWRVVLNRGGGFATEIQLWEAPWSSIRTEETDGTTHRFCFDLDGDGLVDFVDFGANAYTPALYRNRAGAWCASTDGVTCASSGAAAFVAPNPNGIRPDLMVRTENGIGGTTALEYRPSTQWDNTGGDGIPDLPFPTWTLTRIERDDGLCDSITGDCVTTDSHHVITDLTYLYGRFDAFDRAFRGFQMVSALDGGSSAAVRQGRTTYFHQSAALVGKVRTVQVFDASNGGSFATKPLTRTTNTWECADPSTGTVLSACPTFPAGNVWARLQSVAQETFSGFQLAQSRTTVTTTLAWHQCAGKFYGNAAHTAVGDESALSVHTQTEYACLDNSASYIVDRPIHAATGAAGAPLEEKWFFYDNLGTGGVGRGNVTRVESWLNSWTGTLPACTASSKHCVATTTDYDAYGNVRRVTDALGRATDTEYDSTLLYPSVVTGPAPFSMKKATEYDANCGVLLSETIPYSGNVPAAERSRRQYDTFCRLIASAQPDEEIGVPHEFLTYILGAARQPTVIVTQTVETGNPFGHRFEYTYTDALGRMVQRSRYPALVDGVAGTLSSQTTVYDERGNPASEYSPFFDVSTPPVSVRAPHADTGVTRRAYDALGRPIRIVNPDATVLVIDHSVAWQTTTDDECVTSGSCAGGRTVVIRDAFGRMIEKRLYDRSAFKTRTIYVYDTLGRVTSTTQGSSETASNAKTAVSTVYDTLGRRVQFTDPDSGTWRYAYDAAGNLLYQDDPKANQHVQFCYDALNRVTLECPKSGDYQASASIQGSCDATCSPDEVRYTYGAVNTSANYALGRLVRVADASGQTTFDAYDVRGRVRQVTKSIDPGDDERVTTATTRYLYDGADHLAQIVYPDGEVVSYTYDASGQLYAVRSDTHGEDYLTALTYDVFGRPRVISHGNGAIDTRTYYGKEKRFRPSALLTQSNTALRLLYYYDYAANGLLTRRFDFSQGAPGSAMDESAAFTYDGLGRLLQASGAGIGNNTYQYDYLGNVTSKEGVAFAYSAAKPHTLQQINGSGSGVSHDANGNRLGKPGQQYAYDKKDRLDALSVGGETVSFRYDYTGRRVAKIVDNGAAADAVTVYYNDLMEASGGWVTKYYFAGRFLIATRREASGTFAALPPNPVMVATTSATRPAMILFLRRDVQLAVVIALALIGTSLLCMPGRRRGAGGWTIRHGHVVAVTIAFTATTCPWPLIVRPAQAQCGPPPALVYHYHLDPFGSTELITDQSGAVIEYVRYKPYGEVRGRFDANGHPSQPNENQRSEFTGYESEFLSNLEYAGARFYDPALGMFLTHDPARQFPNPYLYGGGDPLNGTDPSGGIFGIDDLVFVVIVAAAFTAGAIDAGTRTGSVAEAFKGGAIGAGLAVATAAIAYYVVGPVAQTALSPTMQQSVKLAAVGMQGYGTADGFRKGNNASGVFGAVLTAYGLVTLDGEPTKPLYRDAGVGSDPLRLADQIAFNGDNLREVQVADLRVSDALLTGDQGSAPVTRGTGDYGHAAAVTGVDGPTVTVLSADERGIYTATNADPRVGGRTWDVFRVEHVDAAKLQTFAQTQATRGGFAQYVGNRGGNICSSVVARALEASGGPPVPRLFENLVTPNALAGAYGPPIGRIKMPLLPSQ